MRETEICFGLSKEFLFNGEENSMKVEKKRHTLRIFVNFTTNVNFFGGGGEGCNILSYVWRNVS